VAPIILDAEPDIDVAPKPRRRRGRRARSDEARPVLMDIRMPKLDGIEATRQLLTQRDARVLILTTLTRRVRR
jgi:chemotaxis response regulator CheB